MRAHILFPLDEEMKHAHSVLREFGSTDWSGAQFGKEAASFNAKLQVESGRDPLTISVSKIGIAGNHNSAAHTGAVLAKNDKDLVLLVGIAGSLEPGRLPLEAVVVSDHVKSIYPNKIRRLNKSDYKPVNVDTFDMSKFSGDRPFPIDRRTRIHQSVLRMKREHQRAHERKDLANEALSLCAKHSFSSVELQKIKQPVVAGDIFSWNAVIDCSDTIDFLRFANQHDEYDMYWHDDHVGNNEINWPSSDLLAVDMESLGFFRALKSARDSNCKTEGVVVRGISDLAAGKSELDQNSRKTHRIGAVKNATRVAIAIIASRMLEMAAEA